MPTKRLFKCTKISDLKQKKKYLILKKKKKKKKQMPSYSKLEIWKY